ncbi:MAG: hypothetical protein AAF483_30705 [Planctomycetota bacterium]
MFNLVGSPCVIKREVRQGHSRRVPRFEDASYIQLYNGDVEGLVDWLRLEAKLNYDQQFAIAQKLTDIEPAEWDKLLFDADLLDLAGTQN